MVITMAKLRMAQASTHGACKPQYEGGKVEEEKRHHEVDVIGNQETDKKVNLPMNQTINMLHFISRADR